jgi:hypothetical protein
VAPSGWKVRLGGTNRETIVDAVPSVEALPIKEVHCQMIRANKLEERRRHKRQYSGKTSERKQ